MVASCCSDAIYEGAVIVLQARCVVSTEAGGRYWSQADAEALELLVFDASDMSAPVATAAPVVGEAITDELQPWARDAVGQNFTHNFDTAGVLVPGVSYVFQLSATMSGTARPVAAWRDISVAEWGVV